MPITVTEFPTRPAVEFNQVHLRELRISLSEDNVSVAHVRIAYSLFGRDADGVKYMESQLRTVDIPDAFTEAATKAAAGNPSLAIALNSIEAAIASILNERGEHGTVTKT